ncbi:HNH endonuclease [uncultured Winogradskyella sp.]|uniref:HNH endonuclease n=1 Tax=uncultured Winogradskyella sp. TaxID=395353 RepID=UPI00260B105D|nr:HNH endonuclease [uncultured Winogradskyella sp.]
MVDIKGFEGLYAVNKKGEVYSFVSNKYLSLIGKKDWYQTVTLCKEKIKYVSLVHRLVAKTFIPNPENKPCVNHKNGIKSDNRVINLEWCTFSENSLHAIKTKLKIIKKGKDHHLYGKTAHNKGITKKKIIKCNQCSKGFMAYPDSNRKYCSRECYNKQPKNNKGVSKYIPKECEYCKKKFKPKNSKTRFCSRSCVQTQRQYIIKKQKANKLFNNKL